MIQSIMETFLQKVRILNINNKQGVQYSLSIKLILKRIHGSTESGTFPLTFVHIPQQRSMMPLSKVADKIFAVMKKAILGCAEERESRPGRNGLSAFNQQGGVPIT